MDYIARPTEECPLRPVAIDRPTVRLVVNGLLSTEINSINSSGNPSLKLYKKSPKPPLYRANDIGGGEERLKC